MKKILCTVLLFITFTLCIQCAGAAFVEIEVTEYVPGASCSGPDSDGIYTCQVKAGFESVLELFGGIIKYFTLIAALASVLFIVINGILYSMAGINDGLKTGAKDRIMKTLMGLIILLLSGVILNAIAPWIYK